MIWFGRLIDSTGRIHGISVRFDQQRNGGNKQIASEAEALAELQKRYPNSRVEITGAGR